MHIGSKVIRHDGKPKVTGETRYTADLALPGVIWGKCLRSPVPHARIRRIDVDKARKLKGVHAVLTASDLPGRLLGIRLKDMPALAKEKVRFVGEKVAIVGAETRDIAEEAIASIHVEYEDLDAVYDPLEAMDSGAPVLHEKLMSYVNLGMPLPEIPNVHSHAQWTLGDCDQGFREAEFTFEQTFSTHRVHHGYLEPYAAIVAVDPAERILVWAPAKQPHLNRRNLAEALGLEESKIVFQLCPIGGDFGGKGWLMDFPFCYYLARATGRPVKAVMDYVEELTAGNPRHPSVITITTGMKKDGKLWARKVKAIFNSGAYAGFKNNLTVNLPGSRHGAGAYYIPNVRIDAFSVYTNSTPGGIMRGPGDPQMSFAVESHMDHIARELGKDPYELRRMNFLRQGNWLPHGIRLNSNKGKDVLAAVAARLKRGNRRVRKPYFGTGLAIRMRDIGAGEANVEMEIGEDESIHLLTTVPDTGTGAHTVFRQVAGEVLDVSPDRIQVEVGTTDSFPTDVRVAASLVTYLAGQAAHRAASHLRHSLLDAAAAYFECSPASLQVSRGAIRGPRGQKVSFSALASHSRLRGKAIRARGNFVNSERKGDACFFAQVADVEIDPETGQVKVLRIVSVHDVGTIINPVTHRGQIDGAMIMGLGYAVMEDLREEDGRIATANLGEYKIPTIRDVPRHAVVLVRDSEGPGPFQSKPVGENNLIPAAAAIANAIYDAIGVQIRDLPITAEKVYAALHEKVRVPQQEIGMVL